MIKPTDHIQVVVSTQLTSCSQEHLKSQSSHYYVPGNLSGVKALLRSVLKQTHQWKEVHLFNIGCICVAQLFSSFPKPDSVFFNKHAINAMLKP